MFLKKTIKSLGLFVLIFCIGVSTQNKIVTVKAASDDSEIRLDDQNIDTIDILQPSQTYVIKLNSDSDLKIDELHISVMDGIHVFDTGNDKAIHVTNTTESAIFGGKTDYHYLVSLWVNDINVTPKDDYVINNWRIFSAGAYNIFTWKEEDIHKDTELKIQKIKCNKTVTTIKELSCTTDGLIKISCETCNNTDLETIKAPGHTYVIKRADYPTVYNAGTMDLYCTKCGEESTSEIPQYEFNVSVGGSQLKSIRLGHNLLFANTHKEAKYIPFVVSHGESVFDKQHS